MNREAIEAMLVKARSDAINEFSSAASMKASDIVKALPEDVRRFRLESAKREMESRRRALLATGGSET